mmetsp:Transcript_9511/g.17888  ORF Transcript_9511/g.17888 Transcript_9511/m.17888 type:complete len:87 (+) Transcript_9511:106-366(+)
MQIRALSHILNNLSNPTNTQYVITRPSEIHEIDTRTSRRLNHVKKERRGWKPSKHDLHVRARQKGHLQNRGDSYKFGDAKAAKAAL